MAGNIWKDRLWMKLPTAARLLNPEDRCDALTISNAFLLGVLGRGDSDGFGLRNYRYGFPEYRTICYSVED